MSMPYYLVVSGPWGYLLTLLGLVVLYLAVGAAVLVSRGPGVRGSAALGERMSALLFWGSVAAVLGFLGQCHGAYQAVSAILSATEISSAVVAEGFAISFVPTLLGLGILAFAVAVWGALTLLVRVRRDRFPATAPLLLALLAFVSTGCSRAPDGPPLEDITQGVWVLEAAPDRFLWDFATTQDGTTCIVHDIQGAVKLNETPCRSVEVTGDRVRVSMDTGVGLDVEVRLGQRRLVGALSYPDGGGMEVDLRWHALDDFPALAARNEEGPYTYRPPGERGDGWSVGDAGAYGIAPEALEALVAAVDRGEAGVLHSLLVARHGHLLLEEYFHGFGPDDVHAVASCTKSVSSLLVGLAIQEGSIPGVDVHLADYFPRDRASLGAGWEGLTLEDLLTMSLALDWSPEEAENAHGTGPDFFQRVLARSVSGTPGTDWAYVSANVNLLAGVLRQATGEHAEAFAQRALFQPLGIGAWDWEGMKTDGYNLMDGSLRLRPRDMVKLGQLVLDGGTWQGRRVVDEAWIRASTAWHLAAGDHGEGYGYLWWRMEAHGPGGEPVPAVFANGGGSQFIVVVPELDLVVVTTGGNEYNGKHLAAAGAVERYLLPAVEATGA